MKRLDKLLAELCPDGVAYKPLWQLTIWDKRFNGVDRGKQSSTIKYHYFLADELEIMSVRNGTVKLLTTNPSNLYTTEQIAGDHVSEGEIVSIPWGGVAHIQYYKGRFLTADNRITTSSDTSVLNNKFLFYYMKSRRNLINSYYRGSGIKHPSMAKVLDMSIPLPPLPVQKEIVRILDGFTGLISELEAELAARRKQYEQYRDIVLDSGVSNEYCCLNELILSLNTGLNPRQFFKLNTRDASNYYVTIREIHDGKIVFSDKTDRINDTALSLCNNRSNLEVGDVLFSGTGTIGETAVIEEPPTNWNIKEGVYAVKPDPSKVLPRYLHYVFMCSSVRKAYGARIFGGTVKSISMKDLRKIKIPVPSIPEQRRVVEILDRFDALCNDETAGLAAEIAARKKQYEYYRDRLLTFKRKEEGGSVESAKRGKRNSPRKGGRYYTEDGMERLKRSGMKGHEAAERLIAEQIGERHRLLRPLTREAASILKSVKGMVPRALFLSNAIVREAERRAKEEKI